MRAGGLPIRRRLSTCATRMLLLLSAYLAAQPATPAGSPTRPGALAAMALTVPVVAMVQASSTPNGREPGSAAEPDP